ncbi:MAG: hypothetical protein PHR56_05130 [Dehalococcoidales bacterium]|nr:hypothetical protein [Dehalococcoidales bacterium]
MTTYIQSSKPVDFICGNCRNELSFSPSLPIISDRSGYYYLITPFGEHSKLQVVEIKYDGCFQPTENKNIIDVISVKCPKCGKFSSFAIATAVITRYSNGKVEGVLTIKDNSGVSELPIIVMQRLSDESFMPLRIMDIFIEKD